MWVVVTEANVREKISDAELARYRGIAATGGRADPVPGIIAAVVNLVRGYVDASKKYPLGAGVTIPEKLVDPACIIIRQRILNNLPGITITQERTKEYDNAMDLMKAVSKGEFGLEEPTTPTTETSGNTPGPQVSKKTRNFSREKQDGI